MTRHLQKYMQVSGILGPRDPPCVYWVTSSEWAQAVEEVKQMLVHPENQPTPQNFSQLSIPPGLVVINAKTEDQRFVNAMNQQECPKDFAWRRDNMRTG